MEELMRVIAPAAGSAAGAFTIVGLIYLGLTLSHLTNGGGGETKKAIAMVLSGLVCLAFARIYGY